MKKLLFKLGSSGKVLWSKKVHNWVIDRGDPKTNNFPYKVWRLWMKLSVSLRNFNV